MCIKQEEDREKAFSHLFRTHLVTAISAMVSGRLGASQEWKFFFIKHKLHVSG